jgi:hypothetical protein
VTADAGLVPYDLEAPSQVRALVPVYRPLVDAFTEEGRAELARRRAEAQAGASRNQALLAGASSDWLAARRRLAGNVPAALVLDIHRPDGSGFTAPYCVTCADSGPGYEAEPAPWPCATYLAVTGEA